MAAEKNGVCASEYPIFQATENKMKKKRYHWESLPPEVALQFPLVFIGNSDDGREVCGEPI